MNAADNSVRGVWSLTEFGWELNEADCRAGVERELATYREARRVRDVSDTVAEPVAELPDEEGTQDVDENWQGALLSQLIKMPSDSFERLFQKLLLEAGFQNVEATGRSGDGGIDGTGVYKVSLVSFPAYFQCKQG